MPPGEPHLDDIARAVLDGERIDWSAAESTALDAARPFLRHLRLVADLAQAQRSVLPGEEPATGGRLPATPLRPGRADTTRDDHTSCSQWGHLRLLEQIGHGTFGEVFRAWDAPLDREVALKLLPVSSTPHENAIIQEGRLLAKVRHPNVATIYGAEQIDGRIGLWMELVRGRTLEQILTDGGLRTEDIVRIGIELCGAVSAVHAAGLLHRDIKTHNVMRADDGRTVLMDFGAGTDRVDGASVATAGTPLYVAPEVLAGEPATVRSDIYSLGVLLYRLASRSYPVKGRTFHEVRRAHERDERVGLATARPGLRSDLVRAIERACHPDPSRRYESADALARDLAVLQPRPVAVRVGRALATAAAGLVVVLLLSEGGLRFLGEPGLAARLRGVLAATLAIPGNPVILVRPFENRGDAGDDLLVDAVSNGLISQLDNIDGLEVKSQETSFMLKEAPGNSVAIGKRFGVNLVVEGDVRRSEDRLEIRAALVSVASGRPLWSERVERVVDTEGDLVAVVDEMARGIVDRLRLKLGRTQRRYATDLPTFQMYYRAQKGREARGARAAEAVALFRDVIDADPNYAPAIAALAATYGYLGLFYPNANDVYIPPQEAIAQLEPLARRALDLDQFLADGHAAIGFGHALRLRWGEADSSFQRAIDLDSTRSTLYGDYVVAVLLPSGRLDEAVRLLESALDEDPLSLDLRRVLARVLLNAGRYDEALEHSEYVLARDRSFPMVRTFAGWARLFNGDPADRAEALTWLEQWAAGTDRKAGTADDQMGIVGYLHAIHNRRAEAEAIAALPEFEGMPQRQAEIYGLLGDKRTALEKLRALAKLNPHRAAYQLTVPEIGLDLDDPDVRAFRRELGLRD